MVLQTPPIDPASLVRRRRTIRGMSAILLPMRPEGGIDWEGFAAHVARTAASGITPAVNMDTGYVQLIDDATRREALRIARDVVGPTGELVAGACVVDSPGDAFDESRGHVVAALIRKAVLAEAKRNKRSFLDSVLDGVFTVPGDGSVDYPPIFAELKRACYAGWLVVEAEQDPAKAHPLTYARMGRRYLTETARAAGL